MSQGGISVGAISAAPMNNLMQEQKVNQQLSYNEDNLSNSQNTLGAINNGK